MKINLNSLTHITFSYQSRKKAAGYFSHNTESLASPESSAIFPQLATGIITDVQSVLSDLRREGGSNPELWALIENALGTYE